MQTSRVTTSSAGLVLKDPSTGSVRNTISATTSSVQIEKILQQNSPTGGGLVYYNPSTKLLSYGSVSLGIRVLAGN
mgnify:CR=1 FL=1